MKIKVSIINDYMGNITVEKEILTDEFLEATDFLRKHWKKNMEEEP